VPPDHLLLKRTQALLELALADTSSPVGRYACDELKNYDEHLYSPPMLELLPAPSESHR
jgi:hypothetical protein